MYFRCRSCEVFSEKRKRMVGKVPGGVCNKHTLYFDYNTSDLINNF